MFIYVQPFNLVITHCTQKVLWAQLAVEVILCWNPSLEGGSVGVQAIIKERREKNEKKENKIQNVH